MSLLSNPSSFDTSPARTSHMISKASLALYLCICALGCGAGLLAIGTGPGAVSGSSEDHRRTVADAVKIVDDIYRDKGFWDLVAQRSWLAGPIEGREPVRIVSGAQVRDSLKQVAPALQHYSIKTLAGSWIPFHTGGTLARTAVCHDITLDRKHMDPTMLVNTIAHENTHTVPLHSCEDEKYLYTDSDHSDDLEVWLVSYGIGDLAECYRQQGGVPAAVQDCMQSMKDGIEKKGERLRLQCCACTSCAYRDVLARLRKDSGLCNETCAPQCPDPCAPPSRG